MKKFESSLLREKFVIKDVRGGGEPVVALSNRMAVPLADNEGNVIESFVVRAQNMHTCARLAAMVVREFDGRGPIMARNPEFNWEKAWHEVTKGYEQEYNPDIWGCVYNKGKIVFQEGEHHPFLDVVEQCDVKTDEDEYTKSIGFAEEVFRQAGKDVRIEHDTNVALVVSVTPKVAKCGVIVRGAGGTTTFNFTAKSYNMSNKIRMSQPLTVSAAFLEGIQLAFLVGLTRRKRNYGLIEKFSDEDRKGEKAEARLKNLNSAITQYEHAYDVNYRPERPTLAKYVSDAEDFAAELLAPQIRKMLEEGDLDEKDWIQ